MESADLLHFLLGTADEELDLGISFQKVDGADDGANLIGRQGTAPDVDALSVHGGGVFDIAVINLVNQAREFRVRAPLRAVDDDLARGNERVKRDPEIGIFVGYRRDIVVFRKIHDNLFR